MTYVTLQDRSCRVWQGRHTYQPHAKLDIGGSLQTFSVRSIPWRAVSEGFENLKLRRLPRMVYVF